MTFFRKLFGPSRSELERRIVDLEKHFVVERDPASGAVKKTLDQVPVNERKELKRLSTAGMSWEQRKRVLEMTDGGRKVS